MEQYLECSKHQHIQGHSLPPAHLPQPPAQLLAYLHLLSTPSPPPPSVRTPLDRQLHHGQLPSKLLSPVAHLPLKLLSPEPLSLPLSVICILHLQFLKPALLPLPVAVVQLPHLFYDHSH